MPCPRRGANNSRAKCPSAASAPPTKWPRPWPSCARTLRRTSPAPCCPSTAASAWAADETDQFAFNERRIPMDRNEGFEQLRDATVTVLGVEKDQVTEGARFFADLVADSLDLVELVMALEERFDVSIPEEELDGINTVGNALDLILEKLKANA